MLIIPIHKRITAKNFPLVTFLLIITNSLIFFFLQGDDQEVFKKASQYYLQSDLPEIEFPRYQEYRRYSGAGYLQTYPGEEPDSEYNRYYQLMTMEYDGDFMRALKADEIIRPEDPIYPRWKRLRERFEKIQDSSFTQQYLLNYGELDPVSSVSHMFLHGDFGHLFGNMLFLLFLGILVEGALGAELFLLAYLAAGLCAMGATQWVHWGEYGGMLGASGAIAGLMGLYTVLFGTRKVRFFYWVFFFFNYTKKPAIILLPFWLGWELWQFIFDDYSRVAYEAHAGGIVGGAILGLLFKGLHLERREFLDEETKREEAQDLYAEAMEDLRELRVDAARQKFKQLLPQHGHDPELLQRYYNTCKLKPDHPDFHDAARRILTLPGNDTEKLVRNTFRDYVQTSRGRLKLAHSERKDLAVRLANWGHLKEARLLTNALLKGSSANPDIAEAVLATGRACSVHGDQQAAKHYLGQAMERFPGTPEAAAAKKLLTE
jgi:membrane associated rhomboid family serine protease